ncbi:hypothetical protein M2A80_25900 [Klebsiella pneumoniae]|nr:hypothetical protein [Klebsiella pneumoniae]
MTKSTITRERAQQIFLGNGPEPSASEERELARMALAAMDSSESVELPLDYLQGHKDGLEWAARLAEANHPETGDWLYDDPIELAKAIRKGPDMPPAQPVADSEPVAWTWQHLKQWHVTNDEERARDLAWDGVKVEPLYRRAAMLQAGTLTNEGTKQAWTGIPDIDNAINMLDRIDTLDSCDDDRIEAVKTVLRGLAGNSPMWVGVDWAKGCELGNSPVIPDGLPDGVNIYHGPKEKTILVLKQDVAVNQDCWCRTCRPVTLNDMRFVVCPDCGNKRCPRANDHRNACTGSNEPGQEGSAYPDIPREVK